MAAFRVKIIEHTVSPAGVELLTWRLTFPRVILAEVNTHTVLCKNASSSRAIPVEVMRREVEQSPYIPVQWTQNRKGMVADNVLEPAKAGAVMEDYLALRDRALEAAALMESHGLHKQDANRVLEPWAWCRQVLTGTEWSNFFAQRTHRTAHPAFRYLARAMYIAYSQRGQGRRLDYGDWHLPFIREVDYAIADSSVGMNLDPLMESCDGVLPDGFTRWRDVLLCRWSAARCARVSITLDGKPPTPHGDNATYARLAVRDKRAGDQSAGEWDEEPKHMSPCQHQATPMHPAWKASRQELASSLRGFIQFRRTIPAETVREFNPPWHVVEMEWGREVDPAVTEDVDRCSCGVIGGRPALEHYGKCRGKLAFFGGNPDWNTDYDYWVPRKDGDAPEHAGVWFKYSTSPVTWRPDHSDPSRPLPGQTRRLREDIIVPGSVPAGAEKVS